MSRTLSAAGRIAQRKGSAVVKTINRWLRTLTVFTVLWPIIMIICAAIAPKLNETGAAIKQGARIIAPGEMITPGGQAIVAWLALVPIILLGVVFIWNPLKSIGIGLIPGVANQILGGTEEVGRTLKIPVTLPRVPTTGQMLHWIENGLISDAVIGVYLFFVPIWNSPELIVPLILVTFILILLTIRNRARWFRMLLWIAFIAITLIFAYGGQAKASKKTDGLLKSLDALVTKEPPAPPTPATVSPLINLTSCTNETGAVVAKNFVAVGLNNPLGIKFNPGSDILKDFRATESETKATDDGKPFAMFPTQEAGMNAGRTLLHSKTYAGLTIQQGLRYWSTGKPDSTGKPGYGAEILPKDIDQAKLIGNLDPEEFGTMVQAMVPAETGAKGETTKTAVVDMSRFTGDEFVVTGSTCMTNVVMPRQASWSRWDLDIVDAGTADFDPKAWWTAWPAGASIPAEPVYRSATPPYFAKAPRLKVEASANDSIEFHFKKKKS